MNIPELAVKAAEEIKVSVDGYAELAHAMLPQVSAEKIAEVIAKHFPNVIPIPPDVRELVEAAREARDWLRTFGYNRHGIAMSDDNADHTPIATRLIRALEPFTSSPAVLLAVTPQSGPSTDPRAGSAVVDAPQHLRITEVDNG